METLLTALDLGAIITAIFASAFWYQAGARTVRRVSRFEVFDVADINRMVTAMNRSAILNRRAALASAASAACFALRFAADAATAAVTP